MEEILQMRCELEQIAMIKEIIFGGLIVLILEMFLLLTLKINYEYNYFIRWERV